MTMASRIAVFNQGKLIQYGTPDEIYNNPRNMFVAAFIGNPPMNFLRDFTIEEKKYAVRDTARIKLPKEVEVDENKKYVLGFRPEDVVIKEGKEEGAIQGVVYVLEPLGRDVIVNVMMDKTRELVKIFAEPGDVPREGAEVSLFPSEGRIHLFDPDTEEAIL